MRLFIADVCQARLIKTPENVVVVRGNPATLQCRHNGPSIRWLKYGANLTGGYEIVYTGTKVRHSELYSTDGSGPSLKINTTNITTAGTYACDEAGSAMRSRAELVIMNGEELIFQIKIIVKLYLYIYIVTLSIYITNADIWETIIIVFQGCAEVVLCAWCVRAWRRSNGMVRAATKTIFWHHSAEICYFGPWNIQIPMVECLTPKPRNNEITTSCRRPSRPTVELTGRYSSIRYSGAADRKRGIKLKEVEIRRKVLYGVLVVKGVNGHLIYNSSAWLVGWLSRRMLIGWDEIR